MQDIQTASCMPMFCCRINTNTNTFTLVCWLGEYSTRKVGGQCRPPGSILNTVLRVSIG